MNEHIPFVDLKAEYAERKDELDVAIFRVLNSGWFILGPELNAFEHEFAEYCGVRYALGVGTGTDALYLALKALDIGPGDEVITVSHTFIASTLAIIFTGATPVFVDINPQTYTMDPSHVRAAITTRTRAILPVHLYGQMADMGALMAIADEYHLAMVEDACQAHGASFCNQRAGSFGHLGCFSFYPTKNLGAYGDGGAVVTNDQQLADRLYGLRNYGQEKKYYHSSIGTNSRLDEMQSAVLRIKLKYLDENNHRRQQLASHYTCLAGEYIQIPQVGPDRNHIYHIYAILSKHRDELSLRLQENGIHTLIHYPVPVHLQEAIAQANKVLTPLPVTERVANQQLSLPMYPQMSDGQINQIIKTIQEFQTRDFPR